MRARRIDDPRAWLTLATPFLLADEARHNLLLGLGGTLVSHPSWYAAFHLWAVEEDGEVIGAALQTPPHNLALAATSEPTSHHVLAEAIAATGIRLPGVTAGLPEGERFARAWATVVGGAFRRTMEQGVYALSAARDVPRPPGRLRQAAGADRDLLLDWVRDFGAEATPHRPLEESQLTRAVDERLSADDTSAGYVIWELDDGAPVSISGFGGATPNGVRIGPVYTPPDLRGNGYATALVADLSRSQLERGRRFCFLYTDLANPTSNAIYLRIGYELACTSAEFVFEPG
jgi:predicted GNAT family acetyltransferase